MIGGEFAADTEVIPQGKAGCAAILVIAATPICKEQLLSYLLQQREGASMVTGKLERIVRRTGTGERMFLSRSINLRPKRYVSD
jgi:hypothetical protein